MLFLCGLVQHEILEVTQLGYRLCLIYNLISSELYLELLHCPVLAFVKEVVVTKLSS